MSRKTLVASFVLACLAPLAAQAASVSDQVGLAPESMRSELAQDITERWQPYVSKHFGQAADGWAQRMEASLTSADIGNLELAASADSFAQMNAALLGGADAFRKAAGDDDTSQPYAIGDGGADLVYTPLTPCRIVDTRVVGGPIAGNTARAYDAHTTTDFTSQGGDATNCGLPENVSALTVKITSVAPSADGYFTVYPTNDSRPLASSLNYTAGMIFSDESHVRLCRPSCDNDFSVYSFASSDVVIDVTGYFVEPEATALDCTVATQSGTLDLLGGLQPRSVNCPAGYTATGGGCGGPLGIGVSQSEPVVTAGQPSGWRCDLVGSLLSIIAYEVHATCCRVPGR